MAGAFVEDVDGSIEMVIQNPEPLAPGDVLSVELEAVPRRSGPFAWAGSFVPEGRDQAIPAGGDMVLVWVDPDAEEGEEGENGEDEAAVPTDLETVTMAMRELLIQQIAAAPLTGGQRVRLSPTDRPSRSWVVEELLTEALMENGISVVLRQPDGENASREDGMATLYYRLVDTRVVYTPAGGVLRSLFGGEKKSRQASGDLLLRLERVDGTVDWARRVQATRTDVVAARQVDWLGSEDVLHEEVKGGNKILELGLSGSIAIGLLLIFFAP